MDVLFIDDDYAVNRYHEIILGKTARQSNLSLQFYTNPLEAIDYFKSAKKSEYPKLIFLDINMPLMNGWEFIDEFENINLAEDISIIILTTSSNPSYKSRADALKPVKEFKNKPMNEVNFKHLIEKYYKLVA